MCFFGCRDFYHASIIPVRIAEAPRSFYIFHDTVDHFTFPVARFSTPCDTCPGVPAMAIDFPRHFLIVTDIRNIDITIFFLGIGCKVMKRPFFVRSGSKNGREYLSRMASRESFAFSRFLPIAGNLFRSPPGNNFPAITSRFGTKINHPICRLDHIKVVFNNDN